MKQRELDKHYRPVEFGGNEFSPNYYDSAEAEKLLPGARPVRESRITPEMIRKLGAAGIRIYDGRRPVEFLLNDFTYIEHTRGNNGHIVSVYGLDQTSQKVTLKGSWWNRTPIKTENIKPS